MLLEAPFSAILSIGRAKSDARFSLLLKRRVDVFVQHGGDECGTRTAVQRGFAALAHEIAIATVEDVRGIDFHVF